MAFKTPKLQDEDRREIKDEALESWVGFIKDHSMSASQIQRKFTKRALASLAIYLGVENSPELAEGELAVRMAEAIGTAE